MWVNSSAISRPCLCRGGSPALSANRASGCGRLIECRGYVNKATLVIVWLSSKRDEIRSVGLIWCQKEEFPTARPPSLSPFSGCLAEEGTDNIFGKRNAHSALSADNNIIFCHWMGRREGGGLLSTLRSQWQIVQCLRCSVCRVRSKSTRPGAGGAPQLYIFICYWAL